MGAGTVVMGDGGERRMSKEWVIPIRSGSQGARAAQSVNVRLRVRSRSHSLWVQASRPDLCCQNGSLVPLSLLVPPRHPDSFSLKSKYTSGRLGGSVG